MAIIYQHRRHDNNQIFYIGIELDTDKKYVGLRSKSKHRNKFWKRVVNKTGYSIEIVCNDVDNTTAKQIEKYLIGYYGRCDLNLGSLTNLTDGGDGTYGYLHSQESKIKMSNSAKGKIISIETRIKMSNSGKNKTFSDETKLKISQALKGKKHTTEWCINISNSKKGKPAINGVKIINIITGEVFNSIKLAAESIGMRRQTLSRQLNGTRKNNSNFKYLNND